MDTVARHRLAQMLAEARRQSRQIADLADELVPASAAEGYAVNELVSEALGWTPLGWKIAGTNPQMQQRLRLAHPIYGRSFARFEHESPAQFAHADLLDPIVECEFFFRLARPLLPRAAAYDREEVAAAVRSVHAGVEVAECRFPLARLPAIPAVLADGAASGRYVLGPEIADWRTRDLANMAVTLTVNGEMRRHGCGGEVMGDPLNALVWLANERSRWGDGLAAGQLVSTGTATGMLLARRGDVMHADFGGLAQVDLTFA